jgi:hypothetical protein
MAKSLTASMPHGMDLDNSFTIQWAALDPNDGSAVSGVKVSNVGMLVTQVTPGGPEALQVGPFVFVPIDFTPEG